MTLHTSCGAAKPCGERHKEGKTNRSKQNAAPPPLQLARARRTHTPTPHTRANIKYAPLVERIVRRVVAKDGRARLERLFRSSGDCALLLVQLGGRKAVRVLYAGALLLLLAYAGSRFVLEVVLRRSA